MAKHPIDPDDLENIPLTKKGKPHPHISLEKKKRKAAEVKLPPKSNAGRFVKVVDWKIADELLIAGCLGTEVASYFDMCPKTFYERVYDTYGITFTEYCQKKKQRGHALVRAQQFAKALGISKDGDNTLLIWLGKQYLGQLETPQQNEGSETVVKAFNDLMDEITKRQTVDVDSHYNSN